MATTQTQQTRYSFLGLRPRQRSDAAIVNDCVDCVCGTNSATFERSADDGRWRLTREIERRDLNCARATAAAARGVLERVARGADAIQLARSFAAAVARAARLNEAEPSDAAAAHAVAKAAADYVEDAERIVVKWRDADRATLVAIDRAWAPLFRRGLVLEHIITEARGGGASLDVGPLELSGVARRAAASLKTACLARGLSGGADAESLARAFAACAEPLAAARCVLGTDAEAPRVEKLFSTTKTAPSMPVARVRVDAWRADISDGGDPFFVACAEPAMPPPPPLPLPKPPPKPVKSIYEAPPRFLSTKPVQECHDIRDLVRIERDDQLRKLVEALSVETAADERRFVESGGEYWSHDAPSSNAPTPLDVRPKPPSSLYALPGFLRADAEALKNSKSAFDGLEVADALQKAHGRRFDGAPLMDDNVDAILATYGGSFDEAAVFCGKCDRVYDAVTAFRQTFARSRRRRPARSLDVALHACEFVVRTLRDHCRSCLGDALLDARVRTGGAADYEACRVALLRYFAAEDAPSLVVASLGGSLRETVGAPLERALDEAAAACLDEYDADARLDHFRRLKRCVGEARDALGAALVADPRTPALHALRLALDWEGRFFSVEKPRARLSLGV